MSLALRSRQPARAAATALLTAVALSSLAACAARPPRVVATSFVDAPIAPRPADAPVRLYQQDRPTCAYQEIGTVKVKGEEFHAPDRLAEAMRARVRSMGGDAIVNFGKAERVVGQRAVTHGGGMAMGPGMMGPGWIGDPWVGGWPAPVMTDVRNEKGLVLSGTVVRFTDETCAARYRPAA